MAKTRAKAQAPAAQGQPGRRVGRRAGAPPGASITTTLAIGAGSAGCVLANRLSANPRSRGCCCSKRSGRDLSWLWLHIPVGYLYAIGDKRADWRFKTGEEAGLNRRAIAYPRGRVLGGSSAINGMIYMRGQGTPTMTVVANSGSAGWGWDDVLPFFMRHEDHHAGADALRRGGRRITGSSASDYPGRSLRRCAAAARHVVGIAKTSRTSMAATMRASTISRSISGAGDAGGAAARLSPADPTVDQCGM